MNYSIKYMIFLQLFQLLFSSTITAGFLQHGPILCRVEKDCPSLGLYTTCVNGTCRCSHEEIWDQNSQRCLVTLGDESCEPNTKCDLQDSFIGVCVCKDGYIEINGVCSPQIKVPKPHKVDGFDYQKYEYYEPRYIDAPPCGGILTKREGVIDHDKRYRVPCVWTIMPENNFDKVGVYISMNDYFRIKKPISLKFFNSKNELLNEEKEEGFFVVDVNIKTNISGPLKLVLSPNHYTTLSEDENWPNIELRFTYKIFKPVFKNHGVSCSEQNGEICNPIKMLSCTEGRCSCHSNQTAYDPNTGECLSHNKSPCNFSNVLNKGMTIVLKCTQGSECGSDGVCHCNQESYFENFGGKCEPLKDNGQVCNTTIECNTNDSLKCVDGICQCDHMNQGQNKSKCVGQLEMPCFKGKCVHNGYCDSNDICKCSEGFTKSSEGKCQKAFGEICSTQDPCSDKELKCIDGICKCNSPLQKFYKDVKCWSKLYGDCETMEDCPKNMNCFEKYKKKYCSCKSGHIPDITGEICYEPLGIGAPCNHTKTNNNLGSKCDPNGPLYCINGECQCIDDLHLYSPNNKRCYGTNGALCQSRKECSKILHCRKEWVDFVFGRCEPIN